MTEAEYNVQEQYFVVQYGMIHQLSNLIAKRLQAHYADVANNPFAEDVDGIAVFKPEVSVREAFDHLFEDMHWQIETILETLGPQLIELDVKPDASGNRLRIVLEVSESAAIREKIFNRMDLAEIRAITDPIIATVLERNEALEEQLRELQPKP